MLFYQKHKESVSKHSKAPRPGPREQHLCPSFLPTGTIAPPAWETSARTPGVTLHIWEGHRHTGLTLPTAALLQSNTLNSRSVDAALSSGRFVAEK